MAVQLTSVNGQLFANNQPVGGGTTSKQYLPISDTNIEVHEDTTMTICNNIVNSTFNKLGGGTSSAVNALAIDSNGNVYAGGDFTTVTNPDGSLVTVNYIAKWDPISNTWSTLGGGASSVVRALAIDSSNNVYVGGEFANVINLNGSTVANTNGIAKWNINNTWSTLGGGASSIVRALAIDSSNNVYVGGDFTSVGTGLSASRIAKWNINSTWSALGGGASSTVRALAVDSNNNLYVGGDFTRVGSSTGLSANYIAKWNINSTWSALGSGASGFTTNNVNALVFDSNGNLYVGGFFNTVTNTDNTSVSANNIAKWNLNNTWSRLGSGCNNIVNSLARNSSGNIYVGGNFTSVNGVSLTNRIAKILTDTIINISINSNYLTTLVSKEYIVLNYFNENNRIYKTSNGNL